MKRRKCTRRIGQNWIPNSGVCERSNNQRDTVAQSIVIVSPRYRYQSSSSYLSRLGKTKGRESKKKQPIQLRSRISFLPPPLRYRAICYDQYHFYPSPISIIAYTVTFLIPLLFSFSSLFFSFDRFTFSSLSFVFYGSNKGTRTGGEQLPRDTIGYVSLSKKIHVYVSSTICFPFWMK